MQRFSRVHINNYTATTNTASRVELPPDWQDSAEVPLNWPDYAAPEAEAEPQEFTGDFAPRRSRRAPAAPQVQRQAAPPSAPRTSQTASTPQAAPPPGSPSMPVVNQTPPDLAAILARHRATYGEESDTPPLFQPSTTDEAPPRSRSRGPASAPGVQRRTAPPAAAPETTPASPPPDMGGRRRGRVIEEITPAVEDGALPSIEPVEPQAETPAWEEGPADNPERPDLYEALLSEGIVRPAESPDFSDAEVFTPPIQRQSNPATPDMQRAAEETPPAAQTPPPPIRSRASLYRGPSPEPPAAEPPATPRPPAPPTPPVQRAPATDFSAEPDSDEELEAYTPEPGSTEADMLDILGLSPDTPIVDYRSPASSRPPQENTPPSQPSAPSTPATPPRVQRAEQQNPASPPPAPADSPRRPPDFLPELEQTESEPPADDVYFESPPLMRQPDMDMEAFTETYVPPVTDEDQFDQFDEYEPPLPPAAENFTSFFEAAAAPRTDEQPASAPDQPSVPSSPPPSAPIQRAPADDWAAEPDDFDAGFEDFGEFEETQPTEPVQSPPIDQTPPDRPPRQVQRRAAPPSEPPYVPPLPMDDFGEFDDIDDSAPQPGDMTPPPASTRRSMPDTPPPMSPSIRPAVPRLQRSTPPAAPANRPARSEPAARPSESEQPRTEGYNIEGAESLDIGSAPSEHLYRVKGDLSSDVPTQKSNSTTTMPFGLPPPNTPQGGSFPGKVGEAAPSVMGGGNNNPPSIVPPTTSNATPGPFGAATNTSPASNEAPTSETASTTEVSSGDSGQQGGAVENEEQQQESGGPNIDKIARDVYNVLRDRLRIEQERRSRR